MRKYKVTIALMGSVFAFLFAFSTQIITVEKRLLTATVCYDNAERIIDCGKETTPDVMISAIPTNTETTLKNTSSLYRIDDTYIVPESDFTDTVRCPFPALPFRTILDFTNDGTVPLSDLFIRADGDLSESIVKLPRVYIEPGVYKVHLASYHDGTRANLFQGIYGARWHLELFDRANTIVLKTAPTRGVQDDEVRVEETVEHSTVVMREGSNGIGKHDSYPNDNPYSLAPLCAAFDFIKPFISDDVENLDEGKTSIAHHDFQEQPEFIRDIFSISLEANSNGALETKTTVRNKSEEYEKETVESFYTKVPANELGIFGKSNVVRLSKDVVEKRKKILDVFKNNPFDTLLQLSQKERVMVMESIYNETSNTNNNKDEEALKLSTVVISRTSVEEYTSTLQKEIKNDTERDLESFRFKERKELASLKDTDGDGVIDYDEEYLYKTDSTNPFTSGSLFSDGERILLGLNPKDDSNIIQTTESPRIRGDETAHLFTIKEINVVKKDVEVLTGVSNEAIQIRGTAQPLVFVTLYIYSTPIIVTVRTNEEGIFEYQFEEKLENGRHEVYVASVNSTGKILAKSTPFSFVKTTEGIEYTVSELVEIEPTVNDAKKTVVTFFLLVVLLLTVGTIVWFGFIKSEQKRTVLESTIIHKEN